MNEKFKDLFKEVTPQKKHPDQEDLNLWASFKKSVKPLVRTRQNKSAGHDFLPKNTDIESHHEGAKGSTQRARQRCHERNQEAFESFSWGTNQTFAKTEDNFQGTKQKRRLRRRAIPESTIDLHGMTQKEAFHALCDFIKRAHFHGFKTVRVVTGKGLKPRSSSDALSWGQPQASTHYHSEERTQPGILRQALPIWLKAPPLSTLVSDFTQARTNDGGQGAWYLFLSS